MRVTFLAFVAVLTETPLFGAPRAQSNCTTQDGAPVRYEAKLLSVEDAGGNYVPMISWAAPGAPMVGSLHYEWGFLLRFDDPRLQHFDRPTPGMHAAKSGCWVGYHVRPVTESDGRTTNAIVDAFYVTNPWGDAHPIFETPTIVPKIAGYSYVAASKSSNPPYAWIGIWAAKHGKRSMVVAFNERQTKVLGTLPFKLTGITALPAPDAPPVGITLVGDAPTGHPIPLIELTWVPVQESKD